VILEDDRVPRAVGLLDGVLAERDALILGAPANLGRAAPLSANAFSSRRPALRDRVGDEAVAPTSNIGDAVEPSRHVCSGATRSAARDGRVLSMITFGLTMSSLGARSSSADAGDPAAPRVRGRTAGVAGAWFEEAHSAPGNGAGPARPSRGELLERVSPLVSLSSAATRSLGDALRKRSAGPR